MKLRDYQERAKKDISDYLKSDDKSPVVVVQPCGAGKSLLIAVSAQLSKKPVIVLQPSKELLEQNHDKLVKLGGEAYVYSASLGKREKGHITYATPKTLIKDVEDFLDVDVVIIDECHYNCTRGGDIHEIIKKLKPKKVIGLTATPCMLENNSDFSTKLQILTHTSKSIFKKIIHITQVKELVDNGYWSDLVYHKERFDGSALIKNSTGNDFTKDSIIRSYESNDTNEKIAETFRKMKRKGIKHILIFVPSIEIGESLMNKYLKDEVAMVHGKTPKKERERILTSFKEGRTKGVISVDVLTTGFDFPELDGIICARATNSFAIYYQMLGRGVRIHPNKEFCTIIDLCGIVDKFGKVEDITIEDLGTYGHAISISGDYIVTGYNLSGNILTKKEYMKMIMKKPSSFIVPTGKLKTFWFGKHRGVILSKVPKSYIAWMLNNKEFNWYFHPNIEKQDVDNFKQDILNIIKNEQHREIH